jgi:hypothetical protein
VGKGSWTKSPRKKFPEKVEKYKIVSGGWRVEEASSRLIMEKDWVFLVLMIDGSQRVHFTSLRGGGDRDRGELTLTRTTDLDVARGRWGPHGKRGTSAFNRA